MTALLEVDQATIHTLSGRTLFEALSLRLSAERVALVGRNGVGKSTLLAALAGVLEPDSGTITARGKRCFVSQELPGVGEGSAGERRRRALVEARSSQAEILLLDEPSEDLDEAAVSWLRAWLAEWPACLVVATHDRRLLTDFRHFFVASESGCRYFGGTLAELEASLEREHGEAERRYVQNLGRLVAHEEHTTHIARRKARKQRHGRCSELDRATPRIRLNQKRSNAQVSHGRAAKIREERLSALREWSKTTRRALAVNLSLPITVPKLPDDTGDVLELRDVSVVVETRPLFRDIELRLGRERVAIVGPNGAGKTTLLDVMLGRRKPSTGAVARNLSKIGAIGQGGADWALEETLLFRLAAEAPCPEASGSQSGEVATRLLVGHQFPLALARRPMRSLSPGERTRAALMCLFQRVPAVELLVLDEPTYGLDLVGQRALTRALRAWKGGLVVTSHDSDFLSAIGVDRVIELGR